MMQVRLEEAIQLREAGRAEQDMTILEQARALLLDLDTTYPDNAEIVFQLAVVHDNLGLERESIPYYLKAFELGLAGPSLERAYLGLGSTYRGLGDYEKAVDTLRRGVAAFPQNRALQIFLSMALYNTQEYKEALEIALTNLVETTSDEKLQYFSRPILYYASHLDETADAQ